MDSGEREILIFGEVLYDCFEGGAAVLGGAPFNVAWHLKGLGSLPGFISCVGDDALGHRILDAVRRWGLPERYIGIDAQKATGRVRVSLDARGTPAYTIEDDVAYDHIKRVDVTDRLLIFYHGTLALRHESNAGRCLQMKRSSSVRTFVDVNLRSPWWDDGLLEAVLRPCAWLKLNHEELEPVCRALGGEVAGEVAQTAFLVGQLGLEWLVLTRGEAGALLVNAQGNCIQEPAASAGHIQDTVGAGDAFSAVLLYGLAHGWPEPLMLQRAARFAAKVCTLQGAISEEQLFYDEVLQEWNNERN